MSTAEHAFTQALLARGYMKLEEAEALHRSLQIKGTFVELTTSVNKNIGIADLGITQRRVAKADGTAETYIGIVNLTVDQHSKLGTSLSVQQVAFFKALLLTLASEEGYARDGIGSIEADNLEVLHEQAGDDAAAQGESSSQAAGKVKITQKDREEALARLVQDGWLEAVPKPERPERYRIGPRSFLELHKLLSDAAPADVVQMWTQAGSV